MSPGGLKSVKELLLPSRWSLLPSTIGDRSRCAAVNVTDSGVLVIGGIGRNRLPLRSTELLTRGWSTLPPMNEKRKWCAAVNIPDSVLLFMGGVGRKGVRLHSTDLLVRLFYRTGKLPESNVERDKYLFTSFTLVVICIFSLSPYLGTTC
ncbi:unnamed protein product [Hymenolepis diminuta]|uniref:Uncharacterized protein n=1 Tax=Hymenolepis diminuta TaxID=6216 RepID=A0A564YN58_HYMDI|nr:unnamed protein product [Hymenolepis diminuta]